MPNVAHTLGQQPQLQAHSCFKMSQTVTENKGFEIAVSQNVRGFASQMEATDQRTGDRRFPRVRIRETRKLDLTISARMRQGGRLLDVGWCGQNQRSVQATACLCALHESGSGGVGRLIVSLAGFRIVKDRCVDLKRWRSTSTNAPFIKIFLTLQVP